MGAGHGEERTPNMYCMSVTLEVSKLSGRLNAYAFCRESKGGHAVRRKVYPLAGAREAAGDRGARSVQARARLQVGGRACGGAHGEHVAHVRDAGGVEAQRLIKRRRALPRVEQRANRDTVRDEVQAGYRPGGGRAAGDRGASSV